jgi:hypothetical protein
MAQLLVTLWFAFTALLGPGLCCCTLLPSAATPDVADQTPVSAPKQPCKKCCQCDTEPNRAPLTDTPAGSSGTPATPSCPCKDKSPSCVATPKTVTEAKPAFLGFLWLAAVTGFADGTALPVLPHDIFAQAYPLASAQDIYVLQQLRC